MILFGAPPVAACGTINNKPPAHGCALSNKKNISPSILLFRDAHAHALINKTASNSTRLLEPPRICP